MRIFLVVMIIAVVVLILLGVVGWYFSNAVLVPKPYGLMPEFEVLAVGNGTVTLPAPAADAAPETLPQFARTRVQGLYNLLWADGYGRLGEIVDDDGERVERRLELIDGTLPAVGTPARIDVTIFRHDPLRDHGIAFEERTLQGQAGQLAGWWIDQGSDTAVLMLHGRRRADRTETLRILPTVVAEGTSVLVLAYRNHDVSDPSPDGFFHYGASEYQDALTGLAFLAGEGVSRVILYGFSMGGAVALETVKRWPSAGPSLEGLVLDSPMLDPRSVFRQGARAMGLPLADRLADLALFVARLRAGIDWNALDQRRTAADLKVPLLLIAGSGDTTIPVTLTDDFVARLQVPVEYHRLDGVEHVEGWNHDPDAYQGWVGAFLARLEPVAGQR